MYTGIKHIHSFLAYLLLACLAISIIYAALSLVRKKPFNDRSKKVYLLGLVSAHLQFVIGLTLYFTSPVGVKSLSAGAMSNPGLRLYVLEHPIMMLAAIAFITMGYSKAKRAPGTLSAHRKVLLFFTIGLLLMLSRIPWQIWP